MAPSRLEVARVGRAHGLRGEVAVTFTSNRPERTAVGARLYAGDRELVITAARRHQGRWLVQFDDVRDRTQAEQLLGVVLTGDVIDDQDLGDHLWVHEMIGSAVVDRDGHELGTVASVEANPAHDLLVLDGGALIPIVFVTEHAAGRIIVDVPDGLFELQAAVRIDVFSIFPDYFTSPLDASLLGRARADGRLDVRVHDPRESTTDRHRSVDDTPYGGGAGMVMAPGPLFDAVESIVPPRPLLLLSPSGRRFDQGVARELAALPGFSLLCGRYEGVDQRVADHLCDGELTVGDYVLAGGEAAALVVIDAVARLVPGVMGNAESAADESFADGLLEYPQYTRPAEFRGWSVPEVLLSGDHARLARWRRAQALRRTLAWRPDLLTGRPLTPAEEDLLHEFPEGPVPD